MTKKKNETLRIIFFNLYEVKPDSPPVKPEFLYHKENNAIQTSVFETEKKTAGILKHALSQLQPLAHTLFADPKTDVTFFTKLNDKLQRELGRTWQSKAPNWAVEKIPHLLFQKQQDQECRKQQYNFRFSFCKAGGILLERSTFIFYLVITPRLPQGEDSSSPEDMATFVRMMVNSLYYRGGLSKKSGRAAKVERVFSKHNHAAARDEKTERERLQEHFRDNDLPLVAGILGEAITIEDIFDSMAGPAMRQPHSLAGDRFLSQSLLLTPEDRDAPDFSETEYMNLEQLARGQNDRYLLPESRHRSEFVIPIRTFRNVLFFATGEGLACHVKPGRDQQFLIDEFPGRFESIYMLLFVLVVYQRYYLASLAKKIDEQLRKEEQNKEPDKKITVEEIRRLRMQTARHALRIMNTQPTFLSNYRELYSGLQQAFGIQELAEKVQRSCAELDYLLSDQYRREREKESKKFDMAKVILAMVAELFALPYYLYSLLSHWGQHVNWPALIVTVIITLTVVYFTWTNIPEKQRKNIKSKFKNEPDKIWQRSKTFCIHCTSLVQNFRKR